MRIRLTENDIYEVYQVFVTPAGREDEKRPGKYKEMICTISMIYGEGEYARIDGEFDVGNASTFEECENAAKKFMDELWENGCIDISTDKKCAKYGLTIW